MESDQSNSVSLKEHVYALRASDKEALKLALDSADKAVNKAEEAQLRVNQTQNEFRGTLKDQAGLMMPRREYEQAHQTLQKQVDDLKRTVFIGMGIAVALSFGLPILIQFIK